MTTDKCGYCNMEDPTYAYEDGWKICIECGYCVQYDIIRASFQHPRGVERKKTEYKRESYFRRFMDYVRGYDTEKYQLSKAQERCLFSILKEKGIYNIQSYQMLYDILRIYKIRGLVKHIPYICKEYFKCPFPAITSQQSIMMEDRYNELEAKFQGFKTDRTSFLSLGFLLNRFIEDGIVDVELTDNIRFFDICTPQRKTEQLKLYDMLK
jgi:superfamily II DNA or RNA helicase